MPLDPRYFVMAREKAVHEIIDRERPDVVEGSSTWAAGWIAARYRGRCVKTLIMHQDPVAVYPHTLMDRFASADAIDKLCFPYWHYVRNLAGRYDATVVAGEWLRDRLLGFGLENVQAVPFGIDGGLFSPRHRSELVRRELLSLCGLGETGSVLVTVSRHHPEKRLGVLFDAIARVRRSRDVGLIVFGDGPLRNWVEARARRVPGVHLAGFVRDREFMARALASADAMIHGSAAETYGFVIAEAMCSGTPLVVPSRGGAYELVEPTFSECYAPGEAEGCANAIERLLSRDRSALSRAAVESAHSKVRSPQEHFASLFEFYQRLVDRYRAGRPVSRELD